jgi:hypothetical protein
MDEGWHANVIWPTHSQEHRDMWTNEGPNLYLTADRLTVVQEDDTRAAFLLVAHGAQLPLAEAEKYGLTKDAAKAKDTPPPNKLKADEPPNKAKG